MIYPQVFPLQTKPLEHEQLVEQNPPDTPEFAGHLNR